MPSGGEECGREKDNVKKNGIERRTTSTRGVKARVGRIGRGGKDRKEMKGDEVVLRRMVARLRREDGILTWTLTWQFPSLNMREKT